MKNRVSFVILAILVGMLPQNAPACIWDKDTLAMERKRFPSVLELITGKFVRHSEEFYKWRIQDRLKSLEASPNESSFYDDLAVAYDKTGQHDRAIEMMLKKESLKPGLYETYANLGTFYIHAGQYAEGLRYIDKAIKINPNAHFGREVYQRLLVEYLMSRMQGGKIILPLGRQASGQSIRGGFFRFLVRKKSEAGARNQNGNQGLTKGEVKAAVKGILGMMRFGNHRSPVLLEALGDLLSSGGVDEDAKHLAVRAYLKASLETDDVESKKEYRKLAWQSLNNIPVVSGEINERIVMSYEERLLREISQANNWYAKIKSDESKWIAEGRDPEKAFERKYYSKISASETKAPQRNKGRR